MRIETLRINRRGRDLLIQLKRRTGIENWNILCRWAFCLSMAEEQEPREEGALGDAIVEMTWKTFGGEQSELYEELLRQRYQAAGENEADEQLTRMARVHVFRGIGYLAAMKDLKDISGLVELAA